MESSSSRAVGGVLSVLFLFHFLASTAFGLPIEEKLRRLLHPLAANSGDLSGVHVVARQPEKVFGASERKLPPSRSNPTQN